MAMLIHFISDFLRDQSLRCRVIRDPERELQAYGLSDQQRDVLRSGDRHAILESLAGELPPVRKRGNVDIFYPGGYPQVREVTPAAASVNGLAEIIVVGEGFDRSLDVKFRLDTSDVRPQRIDVSCDPDQYQRIRLWVTFPRPGAFALVLRNPGQDEVECRQKVNVT